ncbi:hypothetical protein BTHI11S_05130 [Bosea thiooxidans]
MRAWSRSSDIPISNPGAVLLRALVVTALALAILVPLAG